MATRKYDFPAIRVDEKDIYFNAMCNDLKSARSIVVSKSEDKLIFRPSDGLDGFRPRLIKGRKYFFVPSCAIRNISRIKTGRYYRLHRMNCGAWYVNINEPLGV